MTAAEMANRGLLPRGMRYQPERNKGGVAGHVTATPRPIWEAAARAAQLRGQYLFDHIYPWR